MLSRTLLDCLIGIWSEGTRHELHGYVIALRSSFNYIPHHSRQFQHLFPVTGFFFFRTWPGDLFFGLRTGGAANHLSVNSLGIIVIGELGTFVSLRVPPCSFQG